MANPYLLTLSHATYLGPSGATAAATYQFMTRGYKPPAETRHVDSDVVHNQNGRFKYLYDNGPGFRRWAPFAILCEDAFESYLGLNAEQQYNRLREMWNHKGLLGLEAADEIYSVHWAQDAIEPVFRQYPKQVGDNIEREVTVQFEEG